VKPSLSCLAEVVLRGHFLVHRLNVYDVRKVRIASEESTLLATCDVEQADNLRRDVELLELCFITAFAVASGKVDQDGMRSCVAWCSTTCKDADQLFDFESLSCR
jgi:hypothetical protein